MERESGQRPYMTMACVVGSIEWWSWWLTTTNDGSVVAL